MATKSDKVVKKERPPISPEAREQQMIGYAMDLAEKQLREGTASSQVISLYLKLGSMENKRRMEKLEEENKLLRAKTEALQSAAKSEELYSKALKAMSRYAGLSGGEEDENVY